MTSAAEVGHDLYDLYRELILDHAHNPRNFGRLDSATHTAEGINPLCGDKLRIYLEIDAKHCIRAARFEGSGCAISMASTSLLTETVIGQSVDQAETILVAVTNRLTLQQPDTRAGVATDLEQPFARLQALEGVREFPSRVKCATLPWHALHAALHANTTAATTE